MRRWLQSCWRVAGPGRAIFSAGIPLLLLSLLVFVRAADAAQCLIDHPPPNVFVGCPGDCDGSGDVGVDEIVRIVNVVLGSAAQETCPALLRAPDITSVLQGVTSALGQCPAVIRYRLTDGSKITFAATPPAPSVEEPLTGSFTIVDLGREIEELVFEITNIQFQSATFSIQAETPGEAGCFRVFSGPDVGVVMDATVSINGQVAVLAGDVGVRTDDCCSAPQLLPNLEICSTFHEYCATIFAVREE